MTVSTTGELIVYELSSLPFPTGLEVREITGLQCLCSLLNPKNHPCTSIFSPSWMQAEMTLRRSWHSLDTQISHEMEQMRLRTQYVQIRIHQVDDQLPNFSKEI